MHRRIVIEYRPPRPGSTYVSARFTNSSGGAELWRSPDVRAVFELPPPA
jgi:hypothetical protein